MRKLTLDEWESKYIAGTVERFDQKNQAFNRIHWDPEIKGLLENWSFDGAAREKPGYTLQEYALQQAAWAATRLALFNTSKPNPSPVSQAIMAAMAAGEPGRQNPAPSQEKRQKLEISNPEIMTRNIKKVAKYFGASIVGVCRLDRRWLFRSPSPCLR